MREDAEDGESEIHECIEKHVEHDHQMGSNEEWMQASPRERRRPVSDISRGVGNEGRDGGAILEATEKTRRDFSAERKAKGEVMPRFSWQEDETEHTHTCRIFFAPQQMKMLVSSIRIQNSCLERMLLPPDSLSLFSSAIVHTHRRG